MKVILFGATGMVGQCVLTECLISPIIEEILIVGRRSCGVASTKIKELIHDNFLDYSGFYLSTKKWPLISHYLKCTKIKSASRY